MHLTWNLEQQGRPRFVFETVGKAVAYSGFTTFVAFFIFTRGAIRGSYEMFEAAVIAIALMATLTLITTPLFYYRRGDRRDDEAGQTGEADAADAAVSTKADGAPEGQA